MITTNDEKFYKKLLKLRSHGITKEQSAFQNSIAFATGVQGSTDTAYPGWYMEMQTLGYNYRLTDFQAALGLSQLKRMEKGILRRRAIAGQYAQAFKKTSSVIGQSGEVDGHAYHLYIIEVEDRLDLYNHLRDKNIFTQIHYIPCHLMPYYRQQGWKEGDMPNAETYYKYCLSLPMYPSLTDQEQSFVIDLILNFQ